MIKGRRGHLLTEEEKATNTLRSRIRVTAEHVFGQMGQMGVDMVRTISLDGGLYLLDRLSGQMKREPKKESEPQSQTGLQVGHPKIYIITTN